MQDRFRVRVWDTQEKEMIYDAQATYDNCCRNVGCNARDFQEILDDESLIKMQCLGLKDKNDKLIYEGDILSNVQHQSNWNEMPSYLIGKNFEVKYEPEMGAYLVYGVGYNGNHQPYLDCDCETVFGTEIIGNIYENPKILEE